VKAARGCLGLFFLFCVFVGVTGAWSIGPGLLVTGAFGVTWLVLELHFGAQRAKAHRLEREAVRAREVAEHQAYMAHREGERQARYALLCHRFGQRVAEDIFAGRYWQGATMEMIRESLGAPADIRERVMKTKIKHTYCYRPLDARRYELKVHFENGIVVGWDEA
jgi:hypothetical protein